MTGALEGEGVMGAMVGDAVMGAVEGDDVTGATVGLPKGCNVGQRREVK